MDFSMEDTFFDETLEDYNFVDDLQLDDESDIRPNYFSFKNLNVQDYNLNSPLIADDIFGYKAHLLKRPFPEVFRKKEWEVRDLLFKRLKYNFVKLIDPEDIHRWWGKVCLKPVDNINQIKQLLDMVWKDHSQTSLVYKTFISNWFKDNREILQSQLPIKNPDIMKWGELFLQLHELVLILNASDEEELKSLCKDNNKKLLRMEGLVVGSRVDNFFGTCYMAGGAILFLDHNVLVDRGFLLMMKDLCIARFNTLMGMVLRIDNLYNEADVQSLIDLYRVGDKILVESGVPGYALLKLLEPCCNLLFCIKAKEYRPLIPDFPSFSNHIYAAFEEASKISSYAKEFRDSILNARTIELLTVFYGSFRHWGHPFINYLEGLRALYEQVNMVKNIDDSYSQALGSDLAYMVLKRKFSEKKRWFVDPDKLDKNHPFKEHIRNNTWPTPKQIEDFGDNWHKLPLIKCFEIPDVIDPSLLYSDKSHSMDLSEIIDHIQNKPNEPIPTKKVLQTLLNRPATNWPNFLRQIDQNGLGKNSKAIGLKPKEREMKDKGRFYSLMTWELREYFVITEYLIKTHFVPLFSGLTMADDLNTVLSKLLDRSQGQGGIDYENICIANHIDYEKWNNHKRYEATRYVFEVMGKFLGYPTLIEKTHLIFQECLVYFNDRPDLMEVKNGRVENSSDFRVCWNGQLGGLEGLRQKGWTVVDLLMINREAKIRNTLVKTLAQGDNQVVCTIYKLNHSPTEFDLMRNLKNIHTNNDVIMSAIKKGTEKLGLIINEDETMQSADYLNYGKIPIFRGRILNLFSKRLSRIMCTSNDQILSFGNIMTTVSTNALTISHFDESPVHALHYYDFFGNLTRNVLEKHNPILRGPPKMKLKCDLNNIHYKIATLYLDPSLGGVCGMSPSRFLTRGFPDPVTESLSFWKYIYHRSSQEYIKFFARACGDPPISPADRGGLNKLLEKPCSLNIPKGLSITNLLKTEIKKSLQSSSSDIQNEVISHALDYLNHEEEGLMNFLGNIKPLFPRFLSEFRASTFVGIVDGLVGLFQNSRTIRRSFSRKMQRDINRMTYKSELSTYSLLTRFSNMVPSGMWDCSATKADRLRHLSWGEPVLGTTVPHPLEMFGDGHIKEGDGCKRCILGTGEGDFITTLIPLGLCTYHERRGPYPAYLGSRTSETTSIIQPWEKETNIGLIRKSLKLRNSIHWFVEPESNLAKSILSISKGLTGEEWNQSIGGFKRTGSALHRFGCSRQSSGGYAAINPCKLSWVISTTDTFSIIGDENYDFMFQPSILCAQLNAVEICDQHKGSVAVHHHLSCFDCLRKIEEPTLDSSFIYNHPDMSRILSKWKPENSAWGEKKRSFEITKMKASDFGHKELSFQIGRASGFLYGDMLLGDNKHVEDSSLFPLSLQSKVFPDMFLQGLLDGMIKATGISVIHRRSVAKLNRPRPTLIGGVTHCIENLSLNVHFINLVRKGPIYRYLTSRPHKVPSSYPISDSDLGAISRSWLKKEFSVLEKTTQFYSPLYRRVCIFSDMASPEIIGPYLLSVKTLPLLFKIKISKKEADQLRSLRDESTSIRECNDHKVDHVDPKSAVQCLEEIRHAAKEFKGVKWEFSEQLKWGTEVSGRIEDVHVEYTTSKMTGLKVHIDQFRCPLMSGLRIFQMATGAHYKLRTMIIELDIKYKDFICGGDGSGGMTSCLLRQNWKSRGIYNSLIEYSGVSTRGARPGGPPAVEALGNEKVRCVNFDSVWEEPTDLSTESCWVNFSRLISKHQLSVNLMVFDMEVREPKISDKIESLLEEYGTSLLERRGTVIYKTYLNRLKAQPDDNVLTKVGKYFRRVRLVQTSFTSNRSSEVYVVMEGLKSRPGNNIYVRWDLLDSEVTKFAALRSEEDEFQRAIDLKHWNLLEGVPVELIPDLETELGSMLSILGLDDGISVQLARHAIFLGKHDPGTMFWVLVGVTANGIINMTAEHITGYKVPSDAECVNMISFLVGVGYWLAYQTNNLELFKYLNYINDSFLIVQLVKVRMKKKNKLTKEMVDHFRVDWRIDKIGHFSKKVSLVSKQAMLGSWIRILRRACAPSAHFEPVPEKIWRSFNKKLTWKNIQSRTGILDVLINRKIGYKTGELTLETPDEMEVSYVD
ncbi:polymerase [Vaprio virus]|uniref:Replicase n=1 Tax=Vaprio virus TaxID=2100727 RepID=A0A2P1BSW5_9RHAB|nr:polymerase [Vaprio virus]AVI57368.1 polymerase [Vaprio virus]